MGRGRGGYTEAQPFYRDSGGVKVNDTGSIFVGERYIDMGYETVFRQRHQEIEGVKSFDLTIKSSDDVNFIKNIEVKRITSDNPGGVAKNLRKAFKQLPINGTAAIYLPNYDSVSSKGISLIKEGLAQAERKGFVPDWGHVEVWFGDKQCMILR